MVFTEDAESWSQRRLSNEGIDPSKIKMPYAVIYAVTAHYLILGNFHQLGLKSRCISQIASKAFHFNGKLFL